MYRYVIVEDEYYARLGIEQKVRATGLPFELAGTADNGPDAYRMILELKPDCVITDMEIPLYDGSELLHRLYQAQARAKIVIVSGYSRFRYAQSGIEAGALAYLLKPISVEELRDALLRVTHALEADTRAGQRAMDSAQAERQRLRRLAGGEGDAASPFAALRIDPVNSFIAVAETDGPLPEARSFDELVVLETREDGMLAAAFGETAAVADDLAARLSGVSGVSRAARGVGSLAACVRQARLARLRLPMYAAKGCARYTPFAPSAHGPGKLFDARALPSLMDGDRETLLRLAEEELRDLAFTGGSWLDLTAALWYAAELAAASARLYFDPEASWRLAEEAALAGERDGMAARLVEFAQNAVAEAGMRSEPFTSQVCRYVLEHSTEALTLDLVAMRFNVSPSHLSRSLTAEYGLPFNRLLNAARMRQARMLLVETDEPMRTIAQRCGFNGEKYFIQVFRRVNGATPGDFRTAARERIAADRQAAKC